MQFFYPIMFSLALGLLLTFLAVKVFPKLGMLDRPWKYGLKRERIPYYGGIAIYLTFVTAVLMFLPFDRQVAGVLIGGTMIFIVSLLDDIFDVKPVIRLIVQVLAACILVFSGIGILSISNPFGGTPFVLDAQRFEFMFFSAKLSFALLSAIFTIIWVILIINTINFLDGVPGMVSGTSAIAGAAIFLLAIRPGNLVDQHVVAVMAGVIAVAALSFLIFDFHPPKILMGDTGSMFLGFILATLAIYSGGKVATAFLVLGFPILDAVWAIFRRLLSGKSPFKGDLGHFHHRLIAIGFSERKAMLTIYFVSLVFGGIAVFIGSGQKLVAIIIMAILMVLIGFVMAKRLDIKS
ncbi:MAG: glycosyl transferase family protein, UDP-N-acetylglucosamine:undecaprenyl-P N-acetylglucosaminyl 1-P transferase [Candidatus Peregrinibacteria bacterium GW2011_GWC2_39_14]|nr:MAG: glycosyl transferase family protein, UDP-N-acetylglucosamine:undecaprenyl-P N-acetylglucosaminyl 1-P transferase [Candidatus Peregrinibacteria bacterium GW2011_GWC2_39_14]